MKFGGRKVFRASALRLFLFLAFICHLKIAPRASFSIPILSKLSNIMFSRFLLLTLVFAVKDLSSENEYKLLFNGKDFDGFKIMQRNATEKEARLIYRYGTEGELHLFRELATGTGVKANKNGTHGMLYTKKNYNRYSLKFEYKWGEKIFNNHKDYQYDSGLLYHIQKLKIWPTALQYQIRYNHIENRNHTGDFVASGIKIKWTSKDGTTFEFPSKGGQPQSVRGTQHYAHKNAKYHGLDGKWNACEVIVMGDQWAIHKLNGEIVNIATALGASEGPIAFEAETAEILWRNVMIKEFDKDLPLETFLVDEPS